MRGLSAGDFSGGEIVRDGSAVVGPPGEQEFWVAESSGVGTRTVTWSVEPGEWTVVVANSDGSAGCR